MAHIVDAIMVTLGLDTSKYTTQAENAIKTDERLEKSLDKVEKKGGEVSKNFEGLAKAVKSAAKVFASLAAATGIVRFLQNVAEETRQANEEMLKLQASLGLTAEKINGMRGAGAALGGTAEGMTNSMKSLNKGMNDFVVKGDTTLLPFMNTLGVSMVDSQGKLRDVDKVMLDLSDSFSKMNSEQAYALGQDMGFDEGTIAALMQGRDAMKEMSDYHAKMYTSSKEELAASRELSKNQAQLSAHWQSMKLMIGNAIIPLLVKLTNFAKAFFEFLQDHHKTVKNVFEAMAFVLGAVLIPLFGKALIAALAFIAPFAPFILVVTALAAAFTLLYDDYKVWAEGGQSLFDWGAFTDYINNSKLSVDNLKQSFVYLLTGYTEWEKAAEDGKAWLKLKGFIDENGASVQSLINGFRNLTSDLMTEVIPTLKGYASIVSKVFSGDFAGASAEAKEMGGELWSRIKGAWSATKDRFGNAMDVATGQNIGTANDIGIMANKGGSMPSTAPLKAGAKGNKADFIKKYWGMATVIGQKLDVPPEAVLAQFAAETGWGKSVISGTNNLGNIKAGSSWKGKTVKAYDKIEKSYDPYRVYNTPEEFAEDYVRLMQKNKRYKNVIGSDTPTEFFSELKKAGYATDKDYVKKGLAVTKSVTGELDYSRMQQGAAQAQGMVQQSATPRKLYNSKGLQSDMQSRSVDVKMGDLNIYTTASSVSGITSDAMRGVEASLNNLGTSMA